MAERAHPDDPAFKDHWTFRLRKGILPWWKKLESPYKTAFLWRYKWVSKFCKSKDVIDIPCGMGWGTSLISGTRSLRGIDLDKESIFEAKNRYGSKAIFQTGDMSKINLPDWSVDVVSCLEGIEHVPPEVGRTFIKEAYRILRPGGDFLISSPYCKTLAHSGNPFHIHEYQPEEIRALLSELFVVEDCETRDVDIMTVLYLHCRKQPA